MKTKLAILSILWTFLSYAQPLNVPVHAESAILINADTGVVLFEKNADEVRFPGSITKVATSWYILENYAHRLHENVTVSKDAVTWAPVHLKRSNSEKYPSYWLESGATLMNIAEGEILPAHVLLHGHMLVSGNDASNALAEHFGGSVKNFMVELNQFLARKGITRTRFDNPHGLHHERHITTAREMAVITALAMQNPDFLKLFSTQSYERPLSNRQPASTIKQLNRLIVPGKFYYSKAIGGKTGHHSKAGFTYVAAAKQGDRTLVAVLLGCKEMTERYRDAKALFEAAFNEKKMSRTLLTEQFDRFPISLPGARQVLQAKMQKDLRFEYYPSEEPNLHASIHWNVPPLPIQEGASVGELVVYDEKNQKLATEPLFAANIVEPTLWKKYRGNKTVPILAMMGMVGISAWGVLSILKKTDGGRSKGTGP
jgi:D-alanyl-D-alanine carboxypeptidase (penicillin-binding protein 5/6)